MAKRKGARSAVPGMPISACPASGTPLDMFLDNYRIDRNVEGKGQIAALIYASRLARMTGLPFDVAGELTTDGKGQVKGIGKAAVQRVLRDYGIDRVLAEEAGRTSRGSLGNIQHYLESLNELEKSGPVDLLAAEAWWVDRARKFFNAKPFVLRFETGKALRAVLRDLFAQAKKRQSESSGTKFVGAMLQHLVVPSWQLRCQTSKSCITDSPSLTRPEAGAAISRLVTQAFM